MTQLRAALGADAKGPAPRAAARADAARPGQAPPFVRKKPQADGIGAKPDAGRMKPAGGPTRELSPDERIAALERELDIFNEVLDALAGEVERMQNAHGAGERFQEMTTRITEQITQEFDIDDKVTGVDAGAVKRMHQRNVGILDFLRKFLTKLGDKLAEDQGKMEKRMHGLEDHVARLEMALAVRFPEEKSAGPEKSAEPERPKGWPWSRGSRKPK